jgi:hypothetical protein
MNHILRICLLTLTLAVFGCAEPGHYPISGEDCGPNDAVKTLNAADCAGTVG